jgi:predicted acylesterase/phospholipase RssA
MTDKDVIVTNQGSSAGALVAGIVAVLLIALNVQSSDGEANIEVPVPTTATP